MTTARNGDPGRPGKGIYGAGDNVAPVKVLVLGECLVDLAPASPVAKPSRRRQDLVAMPGGGPANVAVGLARLQVPSAFAGRFARGGFGPWLRQNLVDNGLDLSFSVEADEAATIALVTLDSQRRASYTFYGETTADWQWVASELPDLASPGPGNPAVGAVHTGSLALALEPGAGIITKWLTNLRQEGRVVISFDPNVRPALVGDLSAYRERVTDVVRSSHIVKASTEDVEAIYPGTAPRTVADRWLALGAPLVVITEGPDGATAYHQGGGSTHCSAPHIEVADTIGAGDAFTSALLASLGEYGLLSPGAIVGISDAQLQSSVAQAVTASALTCTRLGADPPSRLELARFVDERG
jgi:fructokinase